VRLVAMSDALEKANVPRIEALGKLAEMRGCSIEEVMVSLGMIAVPASEKYKTISKTLAEQDFLAPHPA
jgi:hypothetical protein